MVPIPFENRRASACFGFVFLVFAFANAGFGCRSATPASPAAREERPLPTSSRPALVPASAPVQTRAAAPFDSPQRDFDFGRMSLELRLTPDDLRQKRMSGVVTHRLRALREGLSKVSLNAVGMRIDAIEGGDPLQPLNFAYDGKLLEIALPAAPTMQRETPLRITYRVENPPLGLHFVGDPADDNFTVYSNGEPLQARYWLPCHDWPDARWAGCDLQFTVPKGLVAVSVGEPEGTPIEAPDGASMTYAWKLNVPIDPHLLGFAAARYVEYKVEGGAVPISFFSQPEFEPDAREAFADAPASLEFFAKLCGVDYPFPRFSHVVVPRHFHGGMEHAGFNMIAPLMFQGNPKADWVRFAYLAHMMAHQWFAGLVNYRHITEAWVNEGFGSYLHLLWMREKRGEDAFRAEMRRVRDLVLRFDVAGKSQPMVNREIGKPEDIYGFGGGLVYWKGAWVLHMLREEMGDEVFWRGVRDYLTRNRFGDVDTSDLKAALERASGRDLSDYFEQWVWRDGTPRLKVRWDWNVESKRLEMHIEQTQLMDPSHPAFAIPLEVSIELEGETSRKTLPLLRASESFAWELPGPPRRVRVDPDMRLLASIRVEEESPASQPTSRNATSAPAEEGR